MSECHVTLAGTLLKIVPLRVDPKTSKGYATLIVATTPRISDSEDGATVTTAVQAAGGMALDVLDKLHVGDRVLVQGRVGIYRDRVNVYATVIGLDLRSVHEERAASQAALAGVA